MTMQNSEKVIKGKSSTILNSFWGVLSSAFQILFVSIFFAILARKYNPDIFAHFLIASTVYQLIAAFSTMGLSQWFVREFINVNDKEAFTAKFLKIQLGLGLAFYLVNILFALALYPEGEIRLLCIVLGTNIIFDNFINGIKCLNIAESQQKKTAVILLVDGFLKLVVGCLLFIFPLSILIISILMIVVRIITLSLFIQIGSSNRLNIRLVYESKVLFNDFKRVIIKNWQFVIIGSIAIVYWKIGNIIISKVLSLSEVADYELSFRIFSIFQIIPVVASSTVFPKFVQCIKEKNYKELSENYHNFFKIYTLFSLLSYTFIYSFSPIIIPFAFGHSYPGAIVSLDQMFLTFLLLPTVLLQANILVALGLEKLDMYFNVTSLVVYLVLAAIGFHFVKSLSVINYSVAISFLIFHLLQDYILIKKGIAKITDPLIFYFILTVTVLGYHELNTMLNPYLLFLSFSVLLLGTATVLFKRNFLSLISA
jgi:O-antigen/teichoic acid export membrane protein